MACLGPKMGIRGSWIGAGFLHGVSCIMNMASPFKDSTSRRLNNISMLHWLAMNEWMNEWESNKSSISYNNCDA